MTDHQNEPAIETTEDQLLDHEYDGIQEYDNPLPLWWKAIFWGSIFFAPLYIVFFHFGPGVLPNDRYDDVMTAFYDKQAEELLALGEITDTSLDGLKMSDSMMSTSKKIYSARCATCHGVFAEGGIGPNLCDDSWLHGNRLTEIYKTIVDGVPEKGMLAWKKQLPPGQLMAMAAYVGTLQGSNPPNPKPPQGKQLDPAGMVIVEESEPGDGEPTESSTLSTGKDETGQIPVMPETKKP